MNTIRAGDRLHGLDAVRGLALLLGIVFHLAMSFLPGPQIWVAKDVSESRVLSVAAFAIHLMRMTLFFLIAGLFGRMLFHRLGARAFITNRLQRIALPLVLAWPLVFAAIIQLLRSASADTAPQVEWPALSAANFPLTHLWFLYLLLILYTTVLVVRALVVHTDRVGTFRGRVDLIIRRLFGPWAGLVLALPVAIALYRHPYWVMWFGVPTPDMSLYPNRAALAVYGLSFGLGWLVHRQLATVLGVWERQWPFHLLVAVVATAGCLWTVGVEPLLMPAPQGTRKLWYAAAYALAIWSWTFALLGIGLRYLANYNGWRRYLADASYWMYLAHLPLVMALQLAVATWALPWQIKFLGVLAVTIGALLFSYHYLVRSTVIGAVLNGRRYPRPTSATIPQ